MLGCIEDFFGECREVGSLGFVFYCFLLFFRKSDVGFEVSRKMGGDFRRKSFGLWGFWLLFEVRLRGV